MIFREYYSNVFTEQLPVDENLSNNNPLSLFIRYKPYIIGANPALEISGETIYVLSSIEGRYLDIFPIWKEFFDSGADLVETSKQEFISIQIDVIEDIKYKYRLAPINKGRTIWEIKYIGL